MVKRLISELRLYFCNEWVSKFPSHTLRLWFYKNVMEFRIGRGSSILMHCAFDSSKGLLIGDDSVINSNCRLDTRGGITIGKNVSISQEVIILTSDHHLNSQSFLGRNRKVVIEDYVWIGTRAMILPGVSIGKGAVVAAGAVVTRDVEPFTVVGGTPAKQIGQRARQLTYRLSYRRLFQ